MRVLIAGCGYVGAALAGRLATEGHEVWALRRREAPLPAGVVPIRADLIDVDSLRALPSGLNWVFYMASAGATDDRAYRSAYVDGLRYLLAALDGQPVRRLIFTSSTGVYAQEGGEWVDESSPTEPRHFSGRRMLEGERLLRGSRFASTIVRLAGIYGPGRCRLIDRVRSGGATIPPSPVYANRIHRDDCAAVLHHLMRLEGAEPLYVAADEDPAETAAVLRWLAARLRAPAPPIDHEAGIKRYGRTANKRVCSTRLRASGYRFLFPTFREGYGAIIDAAESVSG